MTPERFTAWREALGGRRFLMSMGAGIVDTILLYVGKLDISAYVTLTFATVATYIAGRTYSERNSNAKPSEPVGNSVDTADAVGGNSRRG
jgi:hypothetical protein